MKNALALLHAYLDNVQDPKAAGDLFAEDGALELPYLASLNVEPRAEGPEAVKAFLENIHRLFADFRFHSLEVLIDTGDQVFAEYEVTTTVVSNGNDFHQLYMGRLVAENGKIKLLRESLDTVASARALS